MTEHRDIRLPEEPPRPANPPPRLYSVWIDAALVVGGLAALAAVWRWL